MTTYLILLRGINVGGKNKVPMAALKDCLERLGFLDITTYIASGNVILRSDKHAQDVKNIIEAALPKNFSLNSKLIKVLVLSFDQLQAIVTHKPQGFGDQPNTYHSDAVFLMDITTQQAMPVFNPRDGVDTVWPGQGVVYSQRVSALRTKSRLSNIISSPLYKSMTIRSWSTTVKLLELLKNADAKK